MYFITYYIYSIDNTITSSIKIICDAIKIIYWSIMYNYRISFKSYTLWNKRFIVK
nr:MAG TPA: hypothetical protein [Bacteriophage sp.]